MKSKGDSKQLSEEMIEKNKSEFENKLFSDALNYIHWSKFIRVLEMEGVWHCWEFQLNKEVSPSEHNGEFQQLVSLKD